MWWLDSEGIQVFTKFNTQLSQTTWLIALNWFFGVLFQVSRLFLEILESAELQGVIFFETVFNYVSTEHLFVYFSECRSMDIL